MSCFSTQVLARVTKDAPPWTGTPEVTYTFLELKTEELPPNNLTQLFDSSRSSVAVQEWSSTGCKLTTKTKGTKLNLAFAYLELRGGTDKNALQSPSANVIKQHLNKWGKGRRIPTLLRGKASRRFPLGPRNTHPRLHPLLAARKHWLRTSFFSREIFRLNSSFTLSCTPATSFAQPSRQNKLFHAHEDASPWKLMLHIILLHALLLLTFPDLAQVVALLKCAFESTVISSSCFSLAPSLGPHLLRLSMDVPAWGLKKMRTITKQHHHHHRSTEL